MDLYILSHFPIWTAGTLTSLHAHPDSTSPARDSSGAPATVLGTRRLAIHTYPLLNLQLLPLPCCAIALEN